MDIELGADIISSDGEKLGVVDSLVVEPENGAIRSLIVRKGFFFPTDRILPISSVTTVGEDGVHVNLTKDDVDQLTEYMDAEYIWPPAGYYGAGGYVWPAAPIYTQDLLVDDEVRERNPDAIILSEGTLVVDSNDDELGRVTELATDERGRVVGFRVEQGFFRHHEHYIPARVVASADDMVVRLSIDKDRLEQITGPEEARQYG